MAAHPPPPLRPPPLHLLPRQLLETSLTLEAIVRTVWLDDENDLVLYYRVSA